MGSNRVGELAGVFDLVHRDQHFRRYLLVELDALLEVGDHRTNERLDLFAFMIAVGDRLGEALEEIRILGEFDDSGALAAFDQRLDRAIGQLQQLQHGADRADRIDIVGLGIVLGRVLLGRQQNLLIVLHNVFEGAHGLLAADEDRHDHMREDDDVAQWQDGIERRALKFVHENLGIA